MLAYARARSPHVEFVRGDATELPFADGSFDAVTCAFLLLHVGRPEAAVAEAARVLAPDGRAAFTVWDDPRAAAGSVWCWTLSRLPERIRLPTCHPARRCFSSRTTSAFSRLLADAGLVDVTVEAVEFPLELESGDELWTGLIDGSVRVRPLVLGQPPEMQRAIRKHFDELVEEYRTGGGSRCRSLSSSLRGESRPSPRCRSRREARRPASTRASRAGGGRS